MPGSDSIWEYNKKTSFCHITVIGFEKYVAETGKMLIGGYLGLCSIL